MTDRYDMDTTTRVPLAFRVAGGHETITLANFEGVVAGYTGRDAAAVQHHIDELAAIGVAPPPEVPMFYRTGPELFNASDEQTVSPVHLTSGEVEPLYIRHNGKYYLGIGSDHTDRDLETEDIGASKRACPKPVSPEVLRVSSIDELSLDDCTARSWVDGRLYQEGKLSGLRTPGDVVRLLLERTDVGDGLHLPRGDDSANPRRFRRWGGLATRAGIP